MSVLVTDKTVTDLVNILSDLPRGQGVPIAVDCETTGLHPYQGDTLRGFSIAFYDYRNLVEGARAPIVSYYIPVGYPEGNLYTTNLHLICAAIHEVDPTYVYHHAKFDLRFLRQLPRRTDGGVYFPVPPVGRFWDTKIVAWLIDENESTSLEVQSQRHLGEGKSEYMTQRRLERGMEALKAEGVKKPTKTAALARGWRELTAGDTAEYGSMDAELTLRLCEHQRDMLDGLFQPMLYGNPRRAVARELQVQALLLRMEDTGIMLDRGRVEELLELALKTKAEIEAEFQVGYAVNVGSNKQVATLLYDTLGLQTKAMADRENGDRPRGPGTGPPSRSVNRSTLETLPPHPLVERILQHRRVAKATSSYLTPLMEKVCEDDRVHPTFWQHGTVTGRFSCSDPNLQTIPREDVLPGVRSVFVAPDGYELWEFDLQAAEMRVVAGMADETVLIEGLNEGTDMHGKLAGEVFGPGYSGVQRRYAKNIGYGFFYGLTSPITAAKYIAGEGATKIASKILDGLKVLYPNVVRLMRRTSKRAEKEGFVPIHDDPDVWPGRFRRFVTEAPNVWPKPYTALNAQVQGGIGELMKDVMLEAEPILEGQGAHLCLQVHDSLVIELPIGSGPWVHEILQGVLDRVNPFQMPMLFDGKPWGDHE